MLVASDSTLSRELRILFAALSGHGSHRNAALVKLERGLLFLFCVCLLECATALATTRSAKFEVRECRVESPSTYHEPSPQTDSWKAYKE